MMNTVHRVVEKPWVPERQAAALTFIARRPRPLADTGPAPPTARPVQLRVQDRRRTFPL
jgi:hypothetical protein